MLHIAVSECRVFQTKERSPCLIAVELYRPDELSLYAQPLSKKEHIQDEVIKNQEGHEMDGVDIEQS